MARTHFFASSQDQKTFRDYVDSLGLIVYPFSSNILGRWKPTKKQIMGGYISFHEISDLQQYKHRKDRFLTKRISHACDPLIMWTPSYLMAYENENFIVGGTIEYLIPYKTNREEEYKKGQAYLSKIQRWIRENWPTTQKSGTAFGEDALRLVQYQGYVAKSLPPDIGIEYVKI